MAFEMLGQISDKTHKDRRVKDSIRRQVKLSLSLAQLTPEGITLYMY